MTFSPHGSRVLVLPDPKKEGPLSGDGEMSYATGVVESVGSQCTMTKPGKRIAYIKGTP